MKRVYLNGLNNIALVIDDGRKVYALIKGEKAHGLNRHAGDMFKGVKLCRIGELLNIIKSDGYKRATLKTKAK